MRKSVCVLLAVLAFTLTSTLALAASKWVVIQTKDGVYKVIKAKGLTPRTVEGPFKTKKEAVAARDRLKAGEKGRGEKLYRGGYRKPTNKILDQERWPKSTLPKTKK